MKIFGYLKKYKIQAILAPVSMLIEVLMDLFLPVFMAVIVNFGILQYDYSSAKGLQKLIINIAGLPTNHITLIIYVGIMMIVATIIGGVFGVLSGVFTNIAAQNYGNDLRVDVFKHIMNLSFEQTDEFSTGSLVTRITNDITQIQNIVSMSMRMIIRTLVQFIGGIYFLLAIKTSFGVVLLVSLPLLTVLIVFFLMKAGPLFKRVQVQVDDVNAILQENVSGTRVIKAYVKENYEINRFDRSNKELYAVNYKVLRILSLISPFMNLFMTGSIVAVMVIGGTNIIKDFDNGVMGAIRTGDLMASINYMAMILSGFLMFAMMSQFIVRGMASVRRVNDVLNSENTVKSSNLVKSSRNGEIEYKNVSFYYPNTSKENVLSDINLNISRGQKIGILGVTGSGKTSLVNLLPRFYDATEGDVLIDGVNVKEYDLEYLRKKVTIVLQKTELFSGSILDNIKWSNKNASFEEVEEAARIAQADTFIKDFDEGYNTVVVQKGTSLSGGQKQRIAIARAIITNPEILIFDDSTSALDLKTEASLYKELYSKLKDTTMIIIAQRIASVKNLDKIAIVHEGRIVDFDNHQNLITYSKIYQDIYNSQLKKDGDLNGKY